MHKSILLGVVFITCMASQCHREPELVQVDSKTNIGKISKNGKLLDQESLRSIYTHAPLDSFDLPIIDDQLVVALDNQIQLLRSYRQRHRRKIGSLEINLDQLERVVLMLKEWQFTHPIDLKKEFDAYRLRGEDGRGNVKFTGYFTPVVPVKDKPDDKYKYPIYRQPKNWVGPLPTRSQIDGPTQILKGRELEIAYASNPVDIYFMQVQGSGYVKYSNGRSKYLAFDGTNRQPYRSIGRFLAKSGLMTVSPDISMDGIQQFLKEHPHLSDTVLFSNPSYTFFKPKGGDPLGSGTVALTPDISIAVDKEHIPLGSVLLASVPVLGPEENVIGHEYRFLVAQDIGGQIKGPGRVDIYCGVGEEGGRKASAIHHYGQMWLLLPKERT